MQESEIVYIFFSFGERTSEKACIIFLLLYTIRADAPTSSGATPEANGDATEKADMLLATILEGFQLDGEDASQTTAEIVANTLKSAITEGLLQPGYKLREVELASYMKSSRTPIREAFRVLQSEGYLEHVPRCGVVVAGLRKDEVSQLWELRSILESAAATKAAANISPEQLGVLIETQKRMESLPPTEHHEYTRLDTILHHTIARASGNAKLEDAITRLWHTASLGRTRSIFWQERAIASCREHRDVIKAIEAGEAVLANRFMQIHFEQSLKAIIAIQQVSSVTIPNSKE